MADVVLRMDEEVAKHVLWLLDEQRGECPCTASCGLCSKETTAATALRAALDSPPVEEASEYRVVYEERGEPDLFELPLSDPRSLLEARTRARKVPRRGGIRFNVRIQARTITTFSDGSTFTSPWTDLPGEGDGNDG